MVDKYLLLTEFEDHTGSYGPLRAWAINRRGKNEDPRITVRTDKTRLVRYLFYHVTRRQEIP